MKRTLAVAATLLMSVACTHGADSVHRLPTTLLKLRVLAALPGPVDWCDPDIYPSSYVGELLDHARSHLREMQSDRRTYRAILAHEGISSSSALTDDELVRVYGDYKLVAYPYPIHLEQDGDLRRFAVSTFDKGSGYVDRVQGAVSSEGRVTIDRVIRGKDSPGRNFEPNCPICLVRGVLIATPDGPVPVQDMRVGMTVWSVDRFGRRVPAIVDRTRRLAADGEVLRVTLADGRTVVVSPGHPIADGRPIGQLQPGDLLSGSTVRSISPVPYRGFTYDLLPSGPTGTYFADGVLLGSTLHEP